MSVIATAICVGLPRPFNGAELSAIDKRPLDGRAGIRSFGIEGDMVADGKHHGGPDMAVHHYATDHYPSWDEWLGGHSLLRGPAAFGENLMSTGLAESNVRIGDRFRLGTTLLEVSQPRQPCWKIEHRFDRKGMVKRILRTHCCGWYYRVIEEGVARAGEPLELVEEGPGDWTVARVFAAIYDPALPMNPSELRSIAALEVLSAAMRDKAKSRLGE
ncbi:MOSC domain-containing protein [Qipengyuania sp. XHP0207]|uniref:MOSC domain-containing protein n=1 Tax=Qipengyuania sp. XHP0207 TaxID=3038078 RepID=UPI00241CF581|nr:MOSC domain-containing protein [Qipengyuania sp. XHP0207]MDG5747244.1 MOSC domain-containing protein [Qipengyuania sp. XHP0207]